MGQMTKNLKEKQYINKTAITCHFIIEAVLLGAYLIEVLKGARTIGYYLTFVAVIAAVCMAAIGGVAGFQFFKRRKEENFFFDDEDDYVDW